MIDNQIEQEIQAKGLTAPRVTPADIVAWKDSTLRVTRQIGSGPGAFFNVEVGKNWDYSALQPIDTAPTDGTVFLGYRERDRRWGECYRIQRDDCEMWSFGGSSAAAEGFPEFKPSHWMPLPGVE